MPDQIKNMLIGIFVVSACAVIIFLLLFLHPSVGDQGRLLRVRFADIDKISIGTRVNFAGKPVGEVIDIRELPDVETERKKINGYIYVYELTLRVDTGVNVFNTDIISARTSGLLGEKSIAITPEASDKGESVYLVNKDIIYATETGNVEDALREVKAIAGRLQTTLDYVNIALDSLQKQKFWDNLSGIIHNVNDITLSLNKPDQWSNILSNTQDFTHNLKNSWPQISDIISNIDDVAKSLKHSWPKVDDTFTNFSQASNNIKGFFADLNSPKGTFGKFVKNDDLYLRFTALLSKADTTLNDINHYRILFHLDKHWQRLRARRMNLVQKLSSPQEFRNYFNDEVDQIQTALSRVNMILTETNWKPPFCCDYNLLDNPEYVKVFAELMRRISAIEEEVRLYNTQVVDIADTKTELINYEECCR